MLGGPRREKSQMYCFLESMKASLPVLRVAGLAIVGIHLQVSGYSQVGHTSDSKTQLSASIRGTGTPQTGGVVSCQGTTSSSVSAKSQTGATSATRPHSVVLSWNASTSPDVKGYNIYRRLPNGTYSRSPINSSLISGTTCTDQSVETGTYVYAATAVNSRGVESVHSKEATAVIPPAP